MFNWTYHWLTHDREEYPPIRGEVVVRYVRKEYLSNERLRIYVGLVLYGVLVLGIHHMIFHKFFIASH